MFSMDSSALEFTIEEDAIRVQGSTPITWITDIETFKKDIAGKKRSEISNVINTYDSFEKADVVLKPLWKTKFPADPTKIEIEIAE